MEASRLLDLRDERVAPLRGVLALVGDHARVYERAPSRVADGLKHVCAALAWPSRLDQVVLEGPSKLCREFRLRHRAAHLWRHVLDTTLKLVVVLLQLGDGRRQLHLASLKLLLRPCPLGVGKTVDAVGVATIVVGVVAAAAMSMRDSRDTPAADRYRTFRQRLGRAILLGLELLVAADIIRTVAVTPTFTSAGVLGVIVVIRTFLSFSLEVELEGRLPWKPKLAPISTSAVEPPS